MAYDGPDRIRRTKNPRGRSPLVPIALLAALITPAARAGVLYVHADSPCQQDCNGQDWSHAYRDLQDALANAEEGDEIWVAEGTYVPVQCDPCGPEHRFASFDLRTRVSLYGGFTGSESQRDERDPETNTTILSGDLGRNDGENFIRRGDNSLHVLAASSDVDSPTVLDGFEIRGGHANVGDDQNQDHIFGGGLRTFGGTPSIRNCIFTGNFASRGGGGLRHSSTESTVLTITNTRFVENKVEGPFGSGGGVLLTSNATSAVAFNNCEISDNYASITRNSGDGGGLMAEGLASLEMTGCEVSRNSMSSGNQQSRGGGMFIKSTGSLSLTECTFDGNAVSGAFTWGGAISTLGSTDVTIRNSSFLGNASAKDGGAFHAASVAGVLTITDCEFSNNRGSGHGGGAILIDGGVEATEIRSCLFFGNTLQADGVLDSVGGGLLNQSGEGTLLIIDCSFIGNNTNTQVGAGALANISGTTTSINCLFRGNAALRGTGGAVLNQFELEMLNCTLNRNSANRTGGVFSDATTLTISNTILWDNGGTEESDQIDVSGSSPDINYSCIQGLTGNLGGKGNIDDDPIFEDPANFDLRLQAGSPCIDAADNFAVPEDVLEDIGMRPRFVDDTLTENTGRQDSREPIDMGAHEFEPGDCNNNGVDDRCDLDCGDPEGPCDVEKCGGSLDCQSNGIPDECERDCNENGFPDDCDIRDCGKNDVRCEDCNENGVPDQCDVLASEGFPDGFCEENCSVDCNGNGRPDECEVDGSILSIWDGGFNCPQSESEECWSIDANWCPALHPNDRKELRFAVVIGNENTEAPTVTLDISPTISDMTLAGDAALEVNESSGPPVRSLFVLDEAGIKSRGVLRATNGTRLLVDAALIDQGGPCEDCDSCGSVGVLEAADGVGPDRKSVLEVNGAVVSGGVVRSVGEFSEVHLIGGAVLENVCVDGVVVPDGQSGGFAESVRNRGILEVGPFARTPTWMYPASEGATLDGVEGGPEECVRLGGEETAMLGWRQFSFVNGPNHVIDGAGDVLGGFSNLGTVRANRQGEKLTLSNPGPKRNENLFEAVAGGILTLADDVEGSGDYRAAGGVIQLAGKDGVAVCGDLLRILDEGSFVIENGASIELTQDVRLEGSIQSACDCPPVPGVIRPPIFRAERLGRAIIHGDFRMGAGMEVEVWSEVPLALEGDFINDSSEDDLQCAAWRECFEWRAGGILLNGAEAQTFEVAGQDLEPGFDAFEESAQRNFAMGSVEVVSGADVTFQNASNNTESPDDCEALYVRDLVLRAGANVTVNNCKVYYQSLTDEGASITLTGDCAELRRSEGGGCVRNPAWLCDGDVDGDGQVNPVDAGLVQAAFGATKEQALCNYDLDCDGQINPVDAGIVQSLFGMCEQPRLTCP